MKCPKCGKDVILQKKQVGVDENGNPVLNEYAICKDCKKQWNLDKQRAKKSAPKQKKQKQQNKRKSLSTQTSKNILYRKRSVQLPKDLFLSIPKDRKRNVRSLIILKKRLGKNVLIPKLLMLYLRKNARLLQIEKQE